MKYFVVLALILQCCFFELSFVHLEKFEIGKGQVFMMKMVFETPTLIFASQGDDNTITIHSGALQHSYDSEKYGDLIDFSAQPMYLLEMKGNITSISNSAGDYIVGISGMDRSFRLYNFIKTKGPIYFYQIKDPISPIIKSEISSKSDNIALLNDDNILRIYKLYQQENLQSKINNLQINDQQMYKGINRKLYDIGWRYEMVAQLKPQSQITSFIFDYLQTAIYIGYQNGSITKFARIQQQKFFYVYQNIFTDTNKKISSLSISQDNSLLVAGSQDNFVRIYDIDLFKNLKLFQVIYDANKAIIKVDMDIFGDYLFVSSEDGYARLYNWSKKKKGFEFNREWFIGENDPNFEISMDFIHRLLVIKGKGEVNIQQSCLAAVFNCIVCSNITVCQKCGDLYYLTDGGYCQQCVLFQGCKTCVKQNICTSCFEGFYLNVGMAICQSCSNSIQNCKACQSKYDCTQCYMQFQLHNGKCYFPQNHEIPAIIPLNNKSLTPSTPPPITAPTIRSNKWSITFIVIIIIICILILFLIIAIITLSILLFKKSKNQTFSVKPSPQQSTNHFDQNILTQPIQYQQNKEVIPIPLQPEQKAVDQFKDYRP